MGLLTNIFYLISTSLLIPVMLALLWALVRVLLLAGGMLREYLVRSAARERLAAMSSSLERGELAHGDLPSRPLVAQALTKLLETVGNRVLTEKTVQDCQLSWQVEVERLRSLARLGPALGLMGTLIPLGPALVGLAAGDLQMMSRNLMIAFATTVVGLLVGTVATVLAGTRKAWYRSDNALLLFAANQLPHVPRLAGGGEDSTTGRSERSNEEPDDSVEAAARAARRAKELSHV
jgi:biopolymer transport protein ExbB/TolQ